MRGIQSAVFAGIAGFIGLFFTVPAHGADAAVEMQQETERAREREKVKQLVPKASLEELRRDQRSAQTQREIDQLKNRPGDRGREPEFDGAQKQLDQIRRDQQIDRLQTELQINRIQREQDQRRREQQLQELQRQQQIDFLRDQQRRLQLEQNLDRLRQQSGR